MNDRPTYPQDHVAMPYARNIVNQILDASGADIPTRQAINDTCDQFTAWMLEVYAERYGPLAHPESLAAERERIANQLGIAAIEADHPRTYAAYDHAARIARTSHQGQP